MMKCRPGAHLTAVPFFCHLRELTLEQLCRLLYSLRALVSTSCIKGFRTLGLHLDQVQVQAAGPSTLWPDHCISIMNLVAFC